MAIWILRRKPEIYHPLRFSILFDTPQGNK
jgi:hypothetical protein